MPKGGRGASEVSPALTGAGRAAKDAISALEAGLLTREEWLRLAAQGAELALWYWNERTGALFWDAKMRAIFGVDAEAEMTLDIFYGAVHPDDRSRVQRVWRHQFESAIPYELEYRTLRADGTVRWVAARGQGFYDRAGKPRYMVGVVFDTTERKAAERERLELGGRLLAAQEQERTRIAREIHDDFSQRLAVSIMKLRTLAEAAVGPDGRSLVEDLIGSLTELGGDIQALSHRLHPAKLDVLGLQPSIDALCREMAKEYRLQIDVSHAGVPDRLPGDLKLAAFRIVQEALHNVIKHGDASRAEVRLTGDGDALTVAVTDDGRGLGGSGQGPSGGIGLQTMRERARGAGGDLRIETRPTVEGTVVTATLPLAPNPAGVGAP